MQVPEHFSPYISKFNKFNVEEIQFSGPIYQVKIVDPSSQEEFWTFIQLNLHSEIADAFCSCQESEEKEGCPHLALSYISLFDGSIKPLHERFLQSFWYQMGKIWFNQLGKKIKGKGFTASSKSEEGTRLLDLIKGEKITETEENSIKFSNLSDQEIEDWREGNPSEELSFELSGWSTFVKQLMLYKKPLQVIFQKNNAELPKNYLIEGQDFEIKGSLEEKDWEVLIPTLNTISSNLSVFNQLKNRYREIVFDQDTIRLKPLELPKNLSKNRQVGSWYFLPEKGFYPPLEEEKTSIKGEAIGAFLDLYNTQLAPFIEINASPLSLKYALAFDKEWNLKITPYAFKQGDVQKGKRWGNWLYLPEQGFFSIKDDESIPLLVKRGDVSEFVRLKADWLKSQVGFQVRFGSVETQIIYHINAEGALQFERQLPHKITDTKEFDNWIYVKNEGFFNKTVVPVQLPLEMGVLIKKDLVASFIRRNFKELEQVPGFFNSVNPLQEMGIEVALDDNMRISVEPHYRLKPQFEKCTIRFYEEWIYLEDEGFSEIPIPLRLPEKIRDPFWVAKEQRKEFIEKELPKWQPWIQKMDERLLPPVTMRLFLDHLEEAPFHSWLIDLHYQTEKGSISLKTIIEGFRKKEKFLFLPEGRLDLSSERFQWIKRLRPESIQKNGLNVSTIELLKLHAFEDIAADKSVLEVFKDIVHLKRIPTFDCTELQSTLRPYQKIGAEWLFSITHYLLGGLLCDEMGLGKTHQSMGLIAALRKIKPKAKFLVICPTSVLYHWEDKIQQFFPTLKIKTYHGPFRKKSLKGEYALLLTSYGVLRSDIEELKKYSFDVAFYDEIQVAKNHRSKLYLALQKLKADVKIGLTGTPLENRLRELKALFDLVLPGYMMSESDYNRFIVRPIERMRDMQKKSLLQRLTHPFVLRRKKVDVLGDLPEKIEAISHCELTPQQDKMYRDALLLQRQELLQDILDVKKPVPFLHVFSLLSRLKQICDHPALYYKKPEAYAKYHSGKWELFIELLKEARDSQQKVVVYSQYLGMLDIIENYLKEEGIGFASLRGSTRDRKEQIGLFATDPSCEVFVASLKAAGLGIDLTAASVVIHYDRWWNAARENQATDRVHRYGQSRGVQVFKLVTKNTFEERIHQIIERKKDLLEEAIAVDDHEVMKAFTRDELIELLQYSHIN